ncbi:hypothetical protein [Kitasatospora sp. A2-31]|uniref:hypothetical protein n=1 Tax=Kitasatospora sp. A2-31 TaxID=2916414 RepID=UPI001EE7A195|nr:hypothetical protein [Kitasatospora sp. A2-31]MCG6493774.1 hypothetical protein [Kitasatospora sp. A2-31]
MTWSVYFEADSGHHIVVQFDAPGLPGPCKIDLEPRGKDQLVSAYGRKTGIGPLTRG